MTVINQALGFSEKVPLHLKILPEEVSIYQGAIRVAICVPAREACQWTRQRHSRGRNRLKCPPLMKLCTAQCP